MTNADCVGHEFSSITRVRNSVVLVFSETPDACALEADWDLFTTTPLPLLDMYAVLV